MPSLYIIRLTSDPYSGLKLAPVCRKKIEFELYDYARMKLAQQLIDDQLRKFQLDLLDFDEIVKTRAYVRKGWAADFSTFVSEHDSYTYSGYGPGASSFGLDDQTTVAWLIPHDSAPAVWWRWDDPIGEGRVQMWLNRMADDIEDGLFDTKRRWPTLTEENSELDIPEEVRPPVLVGRGARQTVRRAGTY